MRALSWGNGPLIGYRGSGRSSQHYCEWDILSDPSVPWGSLPPPHRWAVPNVTSQPAAPLQCSFCSSRSLYPLGTGDKSGFLWAQRSGCMFTSRKKTEDGKGKARSIQRSFAQLHTCKSRLLSYESRNFPDELKHTHTNTYCLSNSCL